VCVGLVAASKLPAQIAVELAEQLRTCTQAAIALIGDIAAEALYGPNQLRARRPTVI
jgi:hypothetical protein